MELSTIIAFIGILVANVISVVTLWLTHLRGPDITLLKTPEFKVNGKHLHQNIETWLKQGYIIKRFELEPATFVFANHGGKAGTITKVKSHFVPHKSFEGFYEGFYYNFSVGEPKYTVRMPPLTIKEGDNQYVDFSLTIDTIDWKEKTLAEVLDPKLKFDDIITTALEKSKERFEAFCDFLNKSQELGKLSCTITLTKGRFGTKIKTEKLLENESITINSDKAISSLRKYLHRWESLGSTRVDLLNKMKGYLEGLIRELRGDFIVCSDKVSEKNIGSSKLKVDAWKQLNAIRYSDDRKIRWFSIRSKEGLEEELTKLYEKIAMYNDGIREAMYLGDLRREEDFQKINVERNKVHSEIEMVLKKLSQLYSEQ